MLFHTKYRCSAGHFPRAGWRPRSKLLVCNIFGMLCEILPISDTLALRPLCLVHQAGIAGFTAHFMRFLCLSVLFVFSSLFAATPSFAASELDEREAIVASVAKAFREERFAELNQMARRYREQKSRTASGVWRLASFYDGLSRAMWSYRAGKSNEDALRAVQEKLGRWLRRTPKAPAARIGFSMLYVAQAWAYRGDGPGSALGAEAVDRFELNITRAWYALRDSKEYASVDPHWYVMMLTVARAQNWDRPQFEALVTEAVQREPLYYGIYFTAVEYLLPKWHGSIRDVELFTRAATDRTAQREGESLYARIYWNAAQTEFENRLFKSTSADWRRMKQGFEDIVARYPDLWNLSNYAKFACLAGDRETTRKLLDRIGNSEEDWRAWEPGALRPRCEKWAYANDTASGAR